MLFFALITLETLYRSPLEKHLVPVMFNREHSNLQMKIDGFGLNTGKAYTLIHHVENY